MKLIKWMWTMLHLCTHLATSPVLFSKERRVGRGLAFVREKQIIRTHIARGTPIWCLNAIKSTKNTSQVHEAWVTSNPRGVRLWQFEWNVAKYLCLMGKFLATAMHARLLLLMVISTLSMFGEPNVGDSCIAPLGHLPRSRLQDMRHGWHSQCCTTGMHFSLKFGCKRQTKHVSISMRPSSNDHDPDDNDFPSTLHIRCVSMLSYRNRTIRYHSDSGEYFDCACLHTHTLTVCVLFMPPAPAVPCWLSSTSHIWAVAVAGIRVFIIS